LRSAGRAGGGRGHFTARLALAGGVAFSGCRHAGRVPMLPRTHAGDLSGSPGKITGLAGVVAWAIGSPTHHFFGRLIDRTGSFDLGLAIAGSLPLVAFVFIWAFWNSPRLSTANARQLRALIRDSWPNIPNFREPANVSGPREFTSALAATAVTSLATPSLSLAATIKSGSSRTRRKKIALLATEVRKYSHAQHFIDRFVEGYGWQGQHHRSSIELAGPLRGPVPDRDLSRERARRIA